MPRDESKVRPSQARRLRAEGFRLNGDATGALIDANDPTFVRCECGHIGFYHGVTLASWPVSACSRCSKDGRACAAFVEAAPPKE